MISPFSRTEMMFGPAAMEHIRQCRVAVFGIGGVGGFAAEALVRSGLGAIDLIDNDTVTLTNLNRQVFAATSTLGMPKVEAARLRLLDINPDLNLRTFQTFYLPDTAAEFDFQDYDYIIDAVDTLTAKLTLAQEAQRAGVPIISAMGTGNKKDPTALEVADIYETTMCPLARIMRKECRKRGIRALKVVYSREEPVTPLPSPEDTARRQVPASNAFVPSVAGLILAGTVFQELTQEKCAK